MARKSTPVRTSQSVSNTYGGRRRITGGSAARTPPANVSKGTGIDGTTLAANKGVQGQSPKNTNVKT